jgi:tripartite-type tricarboxylate transporter receptor subunit TctC
MTLTRRMMIASAAIALATPALSADPPLRLIVPLGAGGPTDGAARVLAAALAVELGRPVQVQNLPGGQGATAVLALLAEPADGGTLLFAPASVAGLPFTMKTPPFASMADLDVLAAIGGNRMCLFVHPGLGADSLAGFMQRARGESLRMGQISLGETLISTQLMQAGGFRAERVPYTAGPQLLADLVDGRLQAAVLPSGLGAADAEAGRLHMLACASEQRIAALPQVPTMAEAGLPGLRAPTGHLIVARPGLPAERCAQLAEAVQRAASRPEVQANLKRLHLDGPAIGPAASLALVRETEAAWSRFVQDTGMTPQ